NLIREQQKLEAATAKVAAKEDMQTSPVKELAPRADAGAKEAANIQKSLPQNSPAAQQALANAQGQMADAKDKLDQANATAAQESEKAALSDLYKAQDALQQQIAADQAQLGQQQPDADPNSAAGLAAQLANAQQQ